MDEIVYIDVVLLENFLMNYLLLYFVNRYCSYKSKTWRISLASIIGSFYVFVIFLQNFSFLYSSIIKLLMSIGMIYIAFSPDSIKKLVRTIILFYIGAFTMSGGILALFYLFDFKFETISGAFIIDGVKSYHLIIGSFIANIFIKLGFDFYENYYSLKKNKVNLKITLLNKTCNIMALIDTGNSLKDPITNLPIIVVYIKSIVNILPKELYDIFLIPSKDNYSIIQRIFSFDEKERVSMIPYKTLGVENGSLIGIRVDVIEVKLGNQSKILKDNIIALYNKPISDLGNYDALAYPEILNGGNSFE